MSAKDYDQIAKQAAYRVKQALDLFKDEPPQIKQQGHQTIMARVQRMLNGEDLVIDGQLTTVVPEPQPADINTPGNTEV
jgi:hypothetical protein